MRIRISRIKSTRRRSGFELPRDAIASRSLVRILSDFCSTERNIFYRNTFDRMGHTYTSMIKIVIRCSSGKVKGLNLNFHLWRYIVYSRTLACVRMNNASLHQEEVIGAEWEGAATFYFVSRRRSTSRVQFVTVLLPFAYLAVACWGYGSLFRVGFYIEFDQRTLLKRSLCS